MSFPEFVIAAQAFRGYRGRPTSACPTDDEVMAVEDLLEDDKMESSEKPIVFRENFGYKSTTIQSNHVISILKARPRMGNPLFMAATIHLENLQPNGNRHGSRTGEECLVTPTLDQTDEVLKTSLSPGWNSNNHSHNEVMGWEVNGSTSRHSSSAAFDQKSKTIKCPVSMLAKIYTCYGVGNDGLRLNGFAFANIVPLFELLLTLRYKILGKTCSNSDPTSILFQVRELARNEGNHFAKSQPSKIAWSWFWRSDDGNNAFLEVPVRKICLRLLVADASRADF
nr:uncharacterized protein LOC109188221 isoform X1 [Ipomoea batatas]